MTELQRSAATALLREMSLTEQAVEQRRRLVGLEGTDIASIAAIREIVTSHVDAIAATFFQSLAGLDEARGLTGNPALLERARNLKLEHVIAMVGGEYGLAYAQQRVELAALYSRAGLDIPAFLGAFRKMLGFISLTVAKQFPAGPLEALGRLQALEKVAAFDLAIMVDVLVFERERVIRQQQEAIRELSTPVLQVRDRMLLLPIIGVIDTRRARLITENLLQSIRSTRAKVVVMDVTGVATVDSKVANHLLQTVTAARLMGAGVIVTGLSSDVAQSLAALGIELGRLNTVGDLQGGLEEAERMMGYRLVKEPRVELAPEPVEQ